MTSLLSTVQRLRSAYGATMTDDECARLCNDVAWVHRADGWGVNAKASGVHGVLPNGTKIAHDILHHRPTNELVDILTSAGAASVPTWTPVGPPQSIDRVFVAPVDFSAPTGPTPPAPTPDAVLTALRHMQDRMDALAHDVNVTALEVLALRNDYRKGMVVSIANKPWGVSTGTVKSPA